MPAIKPLNVIAKKWADVTPGRSEQYKQGVLAPKVDWATAAGAAVESMVEGFNAAAGRGAIASGISNAGTPKWKERASTLGASRFGAGVRAAEGEFLKGFSSSHGVIASTNLPPRGPKGSPGNIDRVRVMAEALHNAKIGK